MDFTNFDELIFRSIAIKNEIVMQDPTENGIRKALNFGHTLGHAIENIYSIPHGNAISIGMIAAASISEKVIDLKTEEKIRLIKLLEKYCLPTELKFDKEKAWQVLLHDKKRVGKELNFVLIKKIGEAVVQRLSLVHLEILFNKEF